MQLPIRQGSAFCQSGEEGLQLCDSFWVVDGVLVLVQEVLLVVILVLQRAEEVQSLVLGKDLLFLVQRTKEVVVGAQSRILHLILIVILRLLFQGLSRIQRTGHYYALWSAQVY